MLLKPARNNIRLISHRGNLRGPGNDVKSVQQVIDFLEDNPRFDIEIDVHGFREDDREDWVAWGHDAENDSTPADFSRLLDYKDRIWVHAKDPDAVPFLQPLGFDHVFAHDCDWFAMTTCNHSWGRADLNFVTRSSIWVVEDIHELAWLYYQHECGRRSYEIIYGVCSDYIGEEYLKCLKP